MHHVAVVPAERTRTISASHQHLTERYLLGICREKGAVEARVTALAEVPPTAEQIMKDEVSRANESVPEDKDQQYSEEVKKSGATTNEAAVPG